MHTGSASKGLPKKGANASIKDLLKSISVTASKTLGTRKDLRSKNDQICDIPTQLSNDHRNYAHLLPKGFF